MTMLVVVMMRRVMVLMIEGVELSENQGLVLP